jgi:hypothetical protein
MPLRMMVVLRRKVHFIRKITFSEKVGMTKVVIPTID